MSRAVLIAIHDVAPATLRECRSLAEWVLSIDARARLTLLCVPQFHGGTTLERSAACREWIDARSARGDEVALHGYLHRDDGPRPRSVRDWCSRRVLTASEGEFAAASAAHARERVELGLAMLARCGWPVAGFVPPAWRTSAALMQALHAAPLDYCTDNGGFHRIAHRSHVSVPVIGTSARSRWRRCASRAWLSAMVRATATAACVRVALHPEDARHPRMREAWGDALARLLTDRQALTKGEWLRAQSKSVGSVRSR